MWIEPGALVATYVNCHVQRSKARLHVFTSTPATASSPRSYERYLGIAPFVPWRFGGWPVPTILRRRFARDALIEENGMCLDDGGNEAYESAFKLDGDTVTYCRDIEGLLYPDGQPRHLRVMPRHLRVI